MLQPGINELERATTLIEKAPVSDAPESLPEVTGIKAEEIKAKVLVAPEEEERLGALVDRINALAEKHGEKAADMLNLLIISARQFVEADEAHPYELDDSDANVQAQEVEPELSPVGADEPLKEMV